MKTMKQINGAKAGQYKQHKFNKMMPSMSGEELTRLREDLRKNGLKVLSAVTQNQPRRVE